MDCRGQHERQNNVGVQDRLLEMNLEALHAALAEAATSSLDGTGYLGNCTPRHHTALRTQAAAVRQTLDEVKDQGQWGKD